MASSALNRRARTIAKAGGYYVAEGSYRGTTDDRLGRWYVGNVADAGFRPWGTGHPSAAAAWRAAAEAAMERVNS